MLYEYGTFTLNTFYYVNTKDTSEIEDDTIQIFLLVQDSFSNQEYYVTNSNYVTNDLYQTNFDYILNNYNDFSAWQLHVTPNNNNYTLNYSLYNSNTGVTIPYNSVSLSPGFASHYSTIKISNILDTSGITEKVVSEYHSREYTINQLQQDLDTTNQELVSVRNDLKVTSHLFSILQQDYSNLQNKYDSLNVMGNTFDVVADGVGVVKDVLDIEIAPNISVGMVATIPIVVSVLLFLLKALIK